MEAASRSESVEACVGRNLNGTFMIIRGAERRSGAGMVFLLDPGGHQVEIRGGHRSVLRIGAGRVKRYFIFRTMIVGISAVDPVLSEEKAFGNMEPVFAPIVMCPPVAPSAGVFAERGTGDGLQRGADQILRRGVEGIIVEEIQELGNGGEALLIRKHAGTR